MRRKRVTPSPRDVAEVVLDFAMSVIRVVRPEVQRAGPRQLSLSQLRTLAFLERNPRAPLSAAADAVGTTLPSMSALAVGLVERGLVTRVPSADDRRRLELRLSTSGAAALRAARRAARAAVRTRIGPLSARERTQLVRALARMQFDRSSKETW